MPNAIASNAAAVAMKILAPFSDIGKGRPGQQRTPRQVRAAQYVFLGSMVPHFVMAKRENKVDKFFDKLYRLWFEKFSLEEFWVTTDDYEYADTLLMELRVYNLFLCGS